MPQTREVVCTDPACELDMFEMHFTYAVPDGLALADFRCPYCGEADALEDIEL